MRSSVFTAAFVGLALLAQPAFAGSETQDRDAAIAACRAAIASEAGVPATPQFVDFHRSQTRAGSIDTRFRVRTQPDADRWEARCEFRRRVGEVAQVALDRPQSQTAAAAD
ncbi:MAG: hypothetical protein JNJ73_13785 [Hyphomonadaceae bacterium]|nr:hypothetical protein [Hyphomonadaceae bacterium]